MDSTQEQLALAAAYAVARRRKQEQSRRTEGETSIWSTQQLESGLEGRQQVSIDSHHASEHADKKARTVTGEEVLPPGLPAFTLLDSGNRNHNNMETTSTPDYYKQLRTMAGALEMTLMFTSTEDEAFDTTYKRAVLAIRIFEEHHGWQQQGRQDVLETEGAARRVDGLCAVVHEVLKHTLLKITDDDEDTSLEVSRDVLLRLSRECEGRWAAAVCDATFLALGDLASQHLRHPVTIPLCILEQLPVLLWAYQQMWMQRIDQQAKCRPTTHGYKVAAQDALRQITALRQDFVSFRLADAYMGAIIDDIKRGLASTSAATTTSL